MTEPRLIYLEWTYAVGKPHHTTPDGLPAAVTLRGYTTLIEEDSASLIVAHFLASDGGFMDTVAVPRRSVLRLDFIADVRRADSRYDASGELRHGY